MWDRAFGGRVSQTTTASFRRGPESMLKATSRRWMVRIATDLDPGLRRDDTVGGMGLRKALQLRGALPRLPAARLFEAHNEADDFGDGLEVLAGNDLIDFDTGKERTSQWRVLHDGHVIFLGHFADA